MDIEGYSGHPNKFCNNSLLNVVLSSYNNPTVSKLYFWGY